MRLQDAAQPVFARHETFHPRFGWIRKAYLHSSADPQVFVRPEAPTILGVGKNMVRSIKFWAEAAKVITAVPSVSNPRTPGMAPTAFGDALLSSDGWDPYLEDTASLWLLHSRMLAPTCRLPVFWLALNEFSAIEFFEEDLTQALTNRLAETGGWDAPSRTALAKDISVFLRTYSPGQRAKRTPVDDIFNNPFRGLGLIRPSAINPSGYRFSSGLRPGLSPGIVAAITFDYLARTNTSAQSVTINRLATEPGGPGKVLRLHEEELSTLLDEASRSTDDVSFVAPVGNVQLQWVGQPEAVAGRFLADHYGNSSPLLKYEAVAGARGDRAIGHVQLNLDDIDAAAAGAKI